MSVEPVPQPLPLDKTLAILGRDAVLADLGPERLRAFVGYLESLAIAPGTVLVREGGDGGDMYFVLEGRALVQRRPVRLDELAPGSHFGEFALIAERPRTSSIVAATPMTVARLGRDGFERMAAADPELALAFLRRLVAAVGQELSDMTDSVGLLLRERSLPRRALVEVKVGGETRQVATGTPLRAILPPTVDGRLVVAGLLDRKAVSLNTRLSSDAVVDPLTTAHWEGRRIYRRSVGLVLLEAAWRVDPAIVIRLGASVGFGQVIEVAHPAGRDLATLAEQLADALRRIAEEDLLIHSEWWTVEEAMSHLAEQGWQASANLLQTWRDDAVPMVSCGHLYAPSLGPLLPSTGAIREFHVLAQEDGLRIYFDDEDRRGGEAERAATERAAAARGASSRPVFADDLLESPMDRDHRQWLRSLAMNSVGAFNDLCISGQVSQLIRVAEGFHEKHIGQIADEIARRDAVKVISIAGPSSSGKTTFIKRLTTQLQINGINPVAVSLDNYYVDREKTLRDASGEYDFEALEALDLGLLQDHFSRLLAGERVKTARYDFPLGKNIPDGGPTIALEPGEVLMIEGIHGLNPRLLGPIAGGGQTFRVFVHPTTALPFDRLWRVSVSDVRLLRRIVRDRHQRGYSAAEGIMRWPSVRHGERAHIFPFRAEADALFDSSLIYEVAVLKVYADRYLLEVPHDHAAYTTADRLRQLIDRFVTIYPDQVPTTSILREFIGGSAFDS